MGTDGLRLFYNVGFVNSLDAAELEFVLGHEVLHVVYDHIGRTEWRDERICGIAQDYVVNLDLVEYQIGKPPSKFGVLLDKKYVGMSSEEVYEILYNNADKLDISALFSKVLDKHMNGKDAEGNELSPAEMSALRNELRAAIFAAAQSVSPGSLPAGLRRLMEQFTEPKMNYKELLRRQIEGQVKSDYSFIRPNRRSHHMDAFMPSSIPVPEIEVHVALDLSGSIGRKEQQEFFTEIAGIMCQFQAFKIHVGCWDTKFYGWTTFSQDNQDDLINYEAKGGGGTDPTCIWEALKEEDVVPKQLVVFTDGEIGSNWGDEGYCPTLWIIKNTRKIEAPFGDSVKYE